MRIAVVMLIDSEDYGKKEFKSEIEKLISDIDSESKLIDFEMMCVSKQTELSDFKIHNKIIERI